MDKCTTFISYDEHSEHRLIIVDGCNEGRASQRFVVLIFMIWGVRNN